MSCAGDHLLTVVCLFSREWAWAVEMRASRARARDSLPGIVLQHRDHVTTIQIISDYFCDNGQWKVFIDSIYLMNGTDQ